MDYIPGPELVFKYFPDLNSTQKDQFQTLGALYNYWNQQINVISRKDMDRFYLNHVLHSLSIAKTQAFTGVDRVLDAGTGGGFPGIPLAILFPDVHFHLIDSIGKKIKIVRAVVHQLKLANTDCEQIRAERINDKYHYVMSRAVARLNKFIPWVKSNLTPGGQIICLKGGDLKEEIREVAVKIEVFQVSEFFPEPFFETKKVLRIDPAVKTQN